MFHQVLDQCNLKGIVVSVTLKLQIGQMTDQILTSLSKHLRIEIKRDFTLSASKGMSEQST